MNKTVSDIIRDAREGLAAAGVQNAACEARWLAERFLGCTAAEILSGAMQRGDSDIYEFNDAVVRRKSGEPLQYILGSTDFMGMEIPVDSGVLIPRPETQLLVETAAALCGRINPVCYDLCSGSGCVALALSKALDGGRIYAVEKYAPALRRLSLNTAHDPRITVYRADVLRNALTRLPIADLIVANPPYIPSKDVGGLQREVLREPVTALDGGEDGLIFYGAIVRIAQRRLREGGAVAAECGMGQAEAVAAIFGGGLRDVRVYNDFNGIGRVVSAFAK